MGSFLHELEVTQGVLYRPLVWSTWGRAHSETEAILSNLAAAAARRRGLQSAQSILRRTKAAVGVHRVRRAVAMLRACLPHDEVVEEWLVFEQSDGALPHPWLREIALSGGQAGAVAPLDATEGEGRASANTMAGNRP